MNISEETPKQLGENPARVPLRKLQNSSEVDWDWTRIFVVRSQRLTLGTLWLVDSYKYCRLEVILVIYRRVGIQRYEPAAFIHTVKGMLKTEPWPSRLQPSYRLSCHSFPTSTAVICLYPSGQLLILKALGGNEGHEAGRVNTGEMFCFLPPSGMLSWSRTTLDAQLHLSQKPGTRFYLKLVQ